jgi:hypothetical protein
MSPIKPQRLMVTPPTLEKRLDVLRAIEALVAQDVDEPQHRRAAADETAIALEKLHRDCEALDQAWHEACREAAKIFAQSRARRRANAQRHRAATDALLKRGVDGYDDNEPRIPKHHAGGGEWTGNTVAAADEVGTRRGEPPLVPPPNAPNPPPSSPGRPAAIGAFLGGTAGAIVGGAIGAGGGTVVAPGVGTIGGGIVGAVEVATDGAALGTIVGAAIGGLGSILMNQDSGSSSGEPQSQVPLQRMHSDETTMSSNLSGFNFWSRKSTEEIVQSLAPGAKSPLMVYANGIVAQGNTRIMILQQRGFDVNSLPRVPYP